MTSDVESVSGVMSAPVINITVSYKLTIEEVQRAQSSSASPFSGQIIALKQQYANWAIDMITNYLIYWGNAATGTIGLFTVNGTSAWSGSSLTVIKNGASTTKGSDAYVALANVVAQFLTNNYNMVHKVRIAMSTLAYNIFASLPWSAGYNPASALKAMVENFLSGEGKTGAAPDIEIIPDALLSPSTIFNSNATDYLVISAPEIDQNIDGVEPQALLAFGAPLMDFVYPVIPGQYNTGYKTLRRIGGIFAPYTPAVQVFTGFGV